MSTDPRPRVVEPGDFDFDSCKPPIFEGLTIEDHRRMSPKKSFGVSLLHGTKSELCIAIGFWSGIRKPPHLKYCVIGLDIPGLPKFTRRFARTTLSGMRIDRMSFRSNCKSSFLNTEIKTAHRGPRSAWVCRVGGRRLLPSWRPSR